MSYPEPIEIIRAKELLQEAKFSEALRLLNDFEEKKGITQEEQTLCYTVKSSIYNRMGKNEEFFKYAKKISQASQGLQKGLLLVDAYIEMARSHIWAGKGKTPEMDKAFDLIVKCEELIEDLTHISKSEVDKRNIVINWMKAVIYEVKKEIAKAQKFVGMSLKLAKELDLKVDIIWALSQQGVIYNNQGDINLALRFHEEGLEIAKEIDYKMMIQSFHSAIGLNYSSKGELDPGVKHLEHSLSVAKEIDYKFGIGACLINLGLLYQQQGNYDRAQDFLKKSFTMFKSIGSPGHTSLDSLFHLAVERGDLEGAKEYLDMLKEVNDNFDLKDIRIIYKVDHAIFLKTSTRSLKRGKAEEILKEVVDGEIINYDAHLIALLNLCDLLLTELRNTSDLEVLNELQNYVTRLKNIAENQNSYWLLAETHLLQGKISLLSFNLKKAKRFLTQAQQIAERFSLTHVAMKIAIENKNLLSKLDLWEKLEEIGAPMTERLELAQLDEHVELLVKNYALFSIQFTEEKVAIHKEKKICLVCRGEVLGFSYICECGAIYCENCARAVSNLENICWICNAPIDSLKPIKSYKIEKKSIKDKGKTNLVFKK